MRFSVFSGISKLKLVVGQFPYGCVRARTHNQTKLFQLFHQNKIVTSRSADNAKIFDCFWIFVGNSRRRWQNVENENKLKEQRESAWKKSQRKLRLQLFAN